MFSAMKLPVNYYFVRGVVWNKFQAMKIRFVSTGPSNGCSGNVLHLQNMPSPIGLPIIGTALSLMAAGSGARQVTTFYQI